MVRWALGSADLSSGPGSLWTYLLSEKYHDFPVWRPRVGLNHWLSALAAHESSGELWECLMPRPCSTGIKSLSRAGGGRHQWFLILSRWFQSRLPAAGLRTSQSFTSEDFLSPWHKPNVSSVPISYSDKLTSHCLLRTLSPISPPRKELLLFLRRDQWHGLHTFSSSSSLWLSCPLRDWPRPRVGRRSSRRGASNEATYLLLLSYLRERCRVEVVEEMMFWHHPWISTLHPIVTPSKAISTLSLCW